MYNFNKEDKDLLCKGLWKLLDAPAPKRIRIERLLERLDDPLIADIQKKAKPNVNQNVKKDIPR